MSAPQVAPVPPSTSLSANFWQQQHVAHQSITPKAPKDENSSEGRPKKRPYTKSQQPNIQIKKDAMWKPLLRMFRRYLKKDALPPATYATIQLRPLTSQG